MLALPTYYYMRWALFILPLFTTIAYSKHIDLLNSRYRSVVYFPNWAIYNRNFTPQELPVSKLTHVLYAFANVKPDTGEVYLSDDNVDTMKIFPGHLRDANGSNLYGCLGQLYLLKKNNRNLKVILSIGGSNYSSNFAGPVSSSTGRSTFASSAVALVKNVGLDGLDINWEYPADDIQASYFVDLLQEVREALDTYGKTLDPFYHFQLTVACPGGPDNYQRLRLSDMDPYIDFWNLMAFDYAGSWSTSTSHQANLFPSILNPLTTPFDTNRTVYYYLSHGILASKIVLGMPLYGRSFESTDGPGMPFTGVGPGGWEAGIYDLKILPLNGAREYNDNNTGSSYSYDSKKKELISYDSLITVKQKAAWIQAMGLGGAMWWESSADKLGDQSLIRSVVDTIGGENGSRLEHTLNELLYLDSLYNNLRAGMPESVVGSSLTQASKSETSSSAATSEPSQATSTSTVIVPGENGISGCAYVLHSNLGDGARCPSDYCNCGGTIAPLLTVSVSGTISANCNYKTQPAINSCPSSILSSTTIPTPSLSTILCVSTLYLTKKNHAIVSTITGSSAIGSYTSRYPVVPAASWIICPDQ